MINMNLNKIEKTSDIRKVYDFIQESSACHLKYSVMVKKALEEHFDDLYPTLCKCLQHSFLANYKEKNIYLERIISFTALLATSFKPTNKNVQIHPTLEKIFKFILTLSNSAHESHRYWSCILFNKMFQNLEELSDELYQAITESMLERLKDMKAAIRCQAVLALCSFQDPTDKEDEVISQLCNTLNSDCNAKVRQLCLQKLAMNKTTLPFILNRIRDVDPNVRLTGFQKLQPVAKYLKVPQKRLILQCGFYDSSEKITNFVATVLLQSWLESYDNEYLKLIKSIRLDACEEDVAATVHLVELMLKQLLKKESINDIIRCIDVNEHKLINYENLNWDSVLYYRIAIQYLRQCDQFEDILNTVLPESVHFCRYIKEYCEFMKQNVNFYELEYDFTLQQLFLITKGYDFGDAATRQCLNSLVHHMLQNEDLSADTAQIIVSNLEKTIPNVNSRSIFVCEMISNLIYGEEALDFEEMERKERERKHAISQLQSDISSLSDQEIHLVCYEKNFAEAERVKLELEQKQSLLNNLKTVQDKPEVEKKTDVKTLSKCLTIAEALLRSLTIKKFNPAIATLHSELINQALVHDDDGVRAKALKCYALCCLIDHRTARYGIHIFSSLIFAADLDDINILIDSLKVVVDLLTIYGLSLIEKKEEEEASDSRREDEKKVFVGGTSLTDLVQALADNLEHEEPLVQNIATKGVCILLNHSRITSPSLLSRIIIKWASPATDDEKLKQFIGFSLNALTKLSNCHTYFADGVICTIRTLAYAPKGTALADINIDNIIKFMAALCQMPQKGAEIHTDLALKICYQMREKPKLKVNLYFSKTLILLTIPEGEAREELLAICDDLRDMIRDSQTLKNVNKFNTILSKSSQKLRPVREEPDAIDEEKNVE